MYALCNKQQFAKFLLAVGNKKLEGLHKQLKPNMEM